MGVEENSQGSYAPREQLQERIEWVKSQEIAKTALKSYLKSRNIDPPDNDSEIVEYIAETLDEDEFNSLRAQFRFSGKKSMNFFVVTGISDEVDQIKSGVVTIFPTAEEVQDEKGKPFLVDTQEFDDRLYIICGEYVSNTRTDPETGNKVRRMYPDECVAVISRDTDLIQVRTAKVPLARKICKIIAKSVGFKTNNDDVFYKPSFDQNFIDGLSEYIEKYVNMTVRVEEGSDRAAGSIRFTSQKMDGDYMDLREDTQVQEELETGGSWIAT